MLSGQQLELSFVAPGPQLRVCSACDKPQSPDEFSAHGKNRCRSCIRAYKRELYRKNEQFREQVKARALLWQDENHRKIHKCYPPECDPALWAKYGHRVSQSLVVEAPVWLRRCRLIGGS